MRGKRWVLTAAMVVAGLRLYMQVRGKATTPFHEWAIGWGVTFFFIALLSEAYPPVAGTVAGTLVVGDFLVNGTPLFKDMSGVVTGVETGGLAEHPFTDTKPPAASGKRGATQQHPPNTNANGTTPQHGGTFA